MKFQLLAVVAACALSTISYGQTADSSSGAVSGSSSSNTNSGNNFNTNNPTANAGASSGSTANNTNTSTNRNVNNVNPTANANSGSSSGAVSSSAGGNATGNRTNNNVNSASSSRTSSSSNASGGAGGAGGGGGTGIGVGIGGNGGQGGVGLGGQGGIGVGGNAGVNANISPSQSITFTSPPVSTSNVNTRATGETTQNVNYHGRTENVQSGETYQYIDYGGTQTIKNVPSMNAPPLTSSNDTCMGSVSGGVAVAGLGLSGGSTYTDEHCKRIKMSRELWNKGMKAASLAMDCMDPAAREALELTGFTCPQTERATRQAAAARAQQVATSESPTRVRSAEMQMGNSGGTGVAAATRAGFEGANLNDPYIARRAAAQGQR